MAGFRKQTHINRSQIWSQTLVHTEKIIVICCCYGGGGGDGGGGVVGGIGSGSSNNSGISSPK